MMPLLMPLLMSLCPISSLPTPIRGHFRRDVMYSDYFFAFGAAQPVALLSRLFAHRSTDRLREAETTSMGRFGGGTRRCFRIIELLNRVDAVDASL